MVGTNMGIMVWDPRVMSFEISPVALLLLFVAISHSQQKSLMTPDSILKPGMYNLFFFRSLNTKSHDFTVMIDAIERHHNCRI